MKDKDMSSESSIAEDDVGNDNTNYTTSQEPSSETRDEIQEIRKQSASDTAWVRRWRFTVLIMLLVTAITITFITYRMLVDQEHENFVTAFKQNSKTVGEAAAGHQLKIHDSMDNLDQLIGALAQSDNANWPLYTIPLYELHASDILDLADVDTVAFIPIVPSQNATDYLDFIGNQHETTVIESHKIKYGNLDLLNHTGYKPFFFSFQEIGYNSTGRQQYYPVWQISPPMLTYDTINSDLSSAYFDMWANVLYELKNVTVISPIFPTTILQEEAGGIRKRDSFRSGTLHAVHQDAFDKQSDIVGWLSASFSWDNELFGLLPEGVSGIIAEFHNGDGQVISYRIDGPDVEFVGNTSVHETKYDNMRVLYDLNPNTHPNFTTTPGHSVYVMYVYPSSEYEDFFHTNTPQTYAIVVAITFTVIAIVFLIYDVMVQRRNEKLIYQAAQSNTIVSDMFPDAIRERLLQQQTSNDNGNTKVTTGKHESLPVAELYPEATIIFADIVGFTAWSSVRDPSQVFVLLETVYGFFDTVAKRRRIFKVETVGDCYVAVSGVPTPRKDHAIAACQFARDILEKMGRLVKGLEVTLGPDTGELTLRIGIHSGPVTGGVLRGTRSRFQLFGDTMNTTARMESTSKPGCIQISQDTANILIASNRQSWFVSRDQVVVAKGKGTMQTYWLTRRSTNSDRTSGSRDGSRSGDQSLSCSSDNVFNDMSIFEIDESKLFNSRVNRLIDWNVGQLVTLIKKVVAHRMVASPNIVNQVNGLRSSKSMIAMSTTSTFPIDEVKEIISLPEFNGKTAAQVEPDKVEISQEVIQQLKSLVTWIASKYRNNPFHNFDHCSHVMMSVIKLMSRIVAPTELQMKQNNIKCQLTEGIDQTTKEQLLASSLHDHTYGITSDPLTQLACAYSALIHDIDHTGVPNATLVAEQSPLATKYNGRSVAEQNSFDIAWEELMSAKYKLLQDTLFVDEKEQKHFRQLVINSVMATDIVDKELKAQRNARWEKAFAVPSASPESSIESTCDIQLRDARNRKATIVIDHLIQASDVSHTMQHWHVFRKWNMRLFEEMYVAYLNGRSEKDPSEFWYQGEIGFFDFYIIPLAKKLKDCGVFGVSSDEYLNYAMKNRMEWETRGLEVVAEMVEAVHLRFGVKGGKKIVSPNDLIEV